MKNNNGVNVRFLTQLALLVAIVLVMSYTPLGYLPLEALGALTGGKSYCSACFDGAYPTPVPEDTRKDQFEQKLSERTKAKTVL